MPNYISLICARYGSKGLPKKNILPILNKPLIAWSIIHAKKIKNVSRIIVSTESKIIAKIAKKYGAEIPFLRPKKLASSSCDELDVWKHTIKKLFPTKDLYPDAIISLPATSPTRNINDVQKCINLYNKGNYDIVITISKPKKNPYFNMVNIDSKGKIKLVCKNYKIFSTRQSAPKVYDMTTVAYVANPKYIMSIKNNNLFKGKVGAVLVDEINSVDIDNILDFKLASIIMKEKNEKKLSRKN